MRIAELFQIVRHFVGELAVIEGVAVGIPAPGRYMRLVYAHRRGIRIGLVLDVFCVRPLKVVYRNDFGISAVEGFAVERERIALIYRIRKTVFDIELVVVVKLDALDGNFPNARFGDLCHAVRVYVPAVEVAYYGYGCGTRRPNAEHRRSRGFVELTAEVLISLKHIPVVVSVEQFRVHKYLPFIHYP